MDKPKPNTLPTGIDADIIMYRCSWASEKEDEVFARAKVDEVVDNIMFQLGGDFYDKDMIDMFLTGKDNFRHEYAVTHPYKGNRKALEKPKHFGLVREYLIDEYGSIVINGREADDELAIQAHKHDYEYIAASIDKDFVQIPCWIYNWGHDSWIKPTEYEANLSFYTQILTGDRVDNIIGLWRVGPVKAAKILEGCETEIEMWKACVEAYEGDTDRIIENARLLWLQRWEGQVWEPPVNLG